MKITKVKIKNTVFDIFFLLSALCAIVGLVFLIVPLFMKDYYHFDKSRISHYNETTIKLKSILNVRHLTQDSIVTEINNILSFSELKEYGDFVKRAIKGKNEGYIYLDNNLDTVNISPSTRKILIENFNKPFSSSESLNYEILLKFKGENLKEIEKHGTNIFYKSANTYFYLDSLGLKPISNALSDSILIVNKGKYLDKDELKFNLLQKIPRSTYSYYGIILDNFISETSSTKEFFYNYGPWLFFPGTFIILLLMLISGNKKPNSNKETEKDIEEAKEQLKNEPNKIKPSWDVAYLTLQQYFEKNLEHINSIYQLSIRVMIVGFLIIGLGILLSFIGSNKNISIIAISCGVLTEFIGTTFLFIFRSTVKQALKYTHTLEKINNVGMSMKILDTIDSEDIDKGELVKAKIEIAKLLIENSKVN